MSQAAISPAENDVLAAGIEALRAQVLLLQKRTAGDDLTGRLFDSALLAIDNLVNDFNSRINAEADDYNQLCDRFESFQSDVNTAMIAISLMVDNRAVNLETVASVLKEWADAHQKALDHVGLLLQQANTRRISAESEFRAYKKANPETLSTRLERAEKENRDLKKERRELKEKVTDLNQKFVKATANLTASNKKLGDTQAALEAVKDQCYRLGEELNRANGMENRPETFPMMYKGRDAVGYIHTYPAGLSATSTLRGEVLISANIRFQICTNWLITMDVVPSIWGVPLYFRIPGFDEDWNTDIDDCLRDKIMDYIAVDFPRLHCRILAAQEAPVNELKMRPETLESIQESGFSTVYSVACIPAEYHESIPFMEGEHRQEIVDACRVWANDWDKVNGGVEALYDHRYRPEHNSRN